MEEYENCKYLKEEGSPTIKYYILDKLKRGAQG